jgi:hypothetical protein
MPILECQCCPCPSSWTQDVVVLNRKLENSPKRWELLFGAAWLCENFLFGLARSDAPNLNPIDCEGTARETMDVRGKHLLSGVILGLCWACWLQDPCIRCLGRSNLFDRIWGFNGEFGWKFLCLSCLRMADSRTKEWKESLPRTKCRISCHSLLSKLPERRRKACQQQCAYASLRIVYSTRSQSV